MKVKTLFEDKVFTISNILTLSRLAVVPVVCYFLVKSHGPQYHRYDKFIILFFFVLGGITDYFDGYLARHLNQISNLGKTLDPIVDKISLGVVMLFLVYYGLYPLWAVVVIIGRDLAVFFLGLFLYIKRDQFNLPNIFGRAMIWAIISSIFFAILGCPGARDLFIYLALVLLVISSFLYGRRLFIKKGVSRQ